MIERTDVLIIGGGPAGLAAGIALAERGIRTLVFERNVYPADKVCGEGLMPTGLAHLERLGVNRHIPPESCYSFKGIRYYSSKGRRLQADFAEGPGIGMRREVLSAALACRAGELPCLEIRAGCLARPTDRTEEGILVEAGGRQIHTRLLIGADGLNSGVRAWAGLDRSRQNIWRWGTRQHFRLHPWSEYVEVYWQKGIEAYITPCAPDLVGVGMLWEPEVYGRVPGGVRLVESLLDSFPTLQSHIRKAEPFDAPRSIGPLQRKVTAPVADRVMLVGDAAGYLDALTGEGLSLALSQALAAARTIAHLLESAGGTADRFSSAALQPYAHAHRRSVRAYTLFTHLALYLSHHPGLLDVIIPLLQRQPALFRALLSASMGRIPGHINF